MVVAQFDTLLKFFTSGATVMKTLALPHDTDDETTSAVLWPAPSASRRDDLNVLAGRDYHLSVEPMRGGIEIAAGSAKFSRYMAQLGSPVVGLIENHPGKIKFLNKVLPGVRICVDYYSHEYEHWPVWSVDWVGGGPPCVWCSRAGKQEFNDPRSEMFCFGTARLAKRFSALVADVEQPLDATTLNDGEAVRKQDEEFARIGMTRTPPEAYCVHSNARDGGGSVRVRVDFHYEIDDMIGTLGDAPSLAASVRLPVTIRDIALPTSSLDPRTFVQGRFTRYHDTIQREDRPTLAGYMELGTAPLQRGSLVELTCDVERRPPASLQCRDPGCLICRNKWRLHHFQGDSAATFVMYNRSRPARRRLDLDHIVKHASFRRPVYSLDGIAQSQTAVGEPPEYHGKTLVLDTRFSPAVVRPLHVMESARLMETPDEDLAMYMELNPTADADEIARFVGDGMAMRFVEAVGARSVSRIKQYKLALAVRRANTVATRLQSFARGRSVRLSLARRLQAMQRRDEDSRGRGCSTSVGGASLRARPNTRLRKGAADSVYLLEGNCVFQRALAVLSGLISTPTFEEVSDLATTGAVTTAQSLFRGFRARQRCAGLRALPAGISRVRPNFADFLIRVAKCAFVWPVVFGSMRASEKHFFLMR